jgi:hypothetical protein
VAAAIVAAAAAVEAAVAADVKTIAGS